MIIEKLPTPPTPNFGDVVDPERPILSVSWSAKGAHRAAAHRHPRAQIVCPTTGAYWVATPQGSWLAPAGQAVWIPPHVRHEVYSNGSVDAMLLFVDIAYAGGLPRTCMAVEVSPLLRGLFGRAVEYGNDYARGGPAARLAGVLLDELTRMAAAPFFLPLSRDRRLSRVMERLLGDPADDAGLDALARAAGASPRTLARLFRRDTGMTFAEWKTQLRLIAAIDRLGRGATVTGVAFDLGYSSASAFTYMFRRKLGVPPAAWRRGMI